MNLYDLYVKAGIQAATAGMEAAIVRENAYRRNLSTEAYEVERTRYLKLRGREARLIKRKIRIGDRLIRRFLAKSDPWS